MHPSIRAVADGFGERIGKVLKAVRSKGSGSLSVRLHADHPSTQRPSHTALMTRPALSIASAAHLFSQSSAGLRASEPMMIELARSRALWRAPKGFHAQN